MEMGKSLLFGTSVSLYKERAKKIRDFLLQNEKIDVNAGDLFFNPFHAVCSYWAENTDDVQEFLKKGVAKINFPGHLNRYPIHMIVSVAHLDKLKMFVDAGALLDVVDSDDNTPLHEAMLPSSCRFRRRIDERIRVAAYLINQGASTTAQNNIGDTALHIACKHMFHSNTLNPNDVHISDLHLEIACFIVKCSDDSLSIKNHEEKTPLEAMGEILLKTKHNGRGNFSIDFDMMNFAIDSIVEHISPTLLK